MSLLSHGHTARLQIVITATETPRLLRHCSGCGAERAFASSGKFRVNAQKKLIDAWLIYRCVECDRTWNCPIHERMPLKAIATDELDALMQNDRDLANRLAVDRARGRAAGARVVPDQRQNWRCDVVAAATPATSEIIIGIQTDLPASLRLDRLLALALGLRRAEILAMAAGDALAIGLTPLKALRRPAQNRQIVRIDLTRMSGDLAGKCRQAAVPRDGN